MKDTSIYCIHYFIPKKIEDGLKAKSGSFSYNGPMMDKFTGKRLKFYKIQEGIFQILPGQVNGDSFKYLWDIDWLIPCKEQLEFDFQFMENLVCVICGTLWKKYANVCSTCGGFCTWGLGKGKEPSSWIKTDKGYTPRPIPPKK